MASIAYFLQKVWDCVPPCAAVIWAAICWAVFPDAAYVPPAIAICIAMFLDLVIKIYALSVNHGGYRQAVKDRFIFSDTLWRKTYSKIIAYIVVMILAGLSVRVCQLDQVGIFVATVIYSFIFIRECQSIIENLIEAGADSLKPLNRWFKKKGKQILEEEAEDTAKKIEEAEEIQNG